MKRTSDLENPIFKYLLISSIFAHYGIIFSPLSHFTFALIVLFGLSTPRILPSTFGFPDGRTAFIFLGISIDIFSGWGASSKIGTSSFFYVISSLFSADSTFSFWSDFSLSFLQRYCVIFSQFFTSIFFILRLMSSQCVPILLSIKA